MASERFTGKAEMPFARSGVAFGVEAAAVVANRERNLRSFRAVRYSDARGCTVADRVGDEFAGIRGRYPMKS